MNLPIITLAQGGGGLASQRLLAEELLPLLAPEHRQPLEDAARVPLAAGEGALVLTTDGFVVQPLVFPGGDLGKLAICGTVNDLAMRGARPCWLTVSLILEEGLPLATLRQIVDSMVATVGEVGAQIVAGDTKVVQRGSGDGAFVSVCGVGRPVATPGPTVSRARVGDQIIVNGALGNHGLAVLAARESLGFAANLRSDCAPLWSLVESMLEAVGDDLHTLRDPTRGGVAAALNEIATATGVGMVLQDEALPVDPAVRGACELLGFDPLAIANEGKVLALVAPASAARLLAAMRQHPLGRESTVIGEVIASPAGRVVVETNLGTRRLLDAPSGELLPRIC